MTAEPLVGWAFSSVLLALRIGPVFAFAPPFTLTRVPTVLRVLFALAAAAALVAGNPQAAAIDDYSASALAGFAVRELLLGSLFVLAFQLTFAALSMAGRTIDTEAGHTLFRYMNAPRADRGDVRIAAQSEHVPSPPGLT